MALPNLNLHIAIVSEGYININFAAWHNINILAWSLWQAQLQEQLSQGEEAQASPDEAQFAQLQSEKVSLNHES